MHTAEVAVGKRVIVQLGKSKFYSGIIRKLHQDVPSLYEVKPVQSVLDELPVVNESQLKFWEWIADYYVCHVGEVMNAALPAALKLQSESKVILNPDFSQDQTDLNSKEFMVYEALLLKHELTVTEVARILHRKSAHSIIKEMIDKGVVLMAEEMHDRYRPKKVVFIGLHENYTGDEQLREVFEAPGKTISKTVGNTDGIYEGLV